VTAHRRPLTAAEHAAAVEKLRDGIARGLADARKDIEYVLPPEQWHIIGEVILAACVADLGPPEG
jgi:hypothetical protein